MLAIGSDEYLDSPHFTPRERAAVLWAEHVAKNTARERDDIFDEVRRHFNDAEFVELTAVCGLFGQSNRFQDSMRLPIEEQHEVDKIRTSVRADPARLKSYVERLIENWPAQYPPAVGRIDPRPAGLPAVPASMPAPRVPMLDAASAPRASAQFMVAAQRLLGGVPNSVRIWAHTPHVAKFFVPFLFAFEHDGAGSVLPAALRLMVLLKTHHLHAAHYLLAHHTVLGRAAGLTEAQLDALGVAGAEKSPLFTPRERAAIAWAALVAPNTAKRNESVFNELAKHFSDAEVVELTALCAICSDADLVYNALRVPLESPVEIAALNSKIATDASHIKVYLQTVLADWPQEWPVLDAGVVTKAA